jgi:hypothetical protein
VPIVATVVAEDVHLAVAVRFCVVPLLYVPVAVNCWLEPKGTDGVDGVTLIEVRTAAVTVSVADPLTVPETAEIVATPGATPVARPLPCTVAMEVEDEFH